MADIAVHDLANGKEYASVATTMGMIDETFFLESALGNKAYAWYPGQENLHHNTGSVILS